MITELWTDPLSFLIWVLALLVAITIHEFAHALAADRLGDPTARLAGRLTLNPLAHLDPLGTLMLLLIRFGWGKPVPFDPYNLKEPRKDSALISFAGPFSNLLLATFLALLLRLSWLTTGHFTSLIQTLLTPIITLNTMLAIFNLIPLHPLDGGKVLIGLLPPKIASEWDQILSQYGFLILIFLLFPFFGFSPILLIIFPIIRFILNLLLPSLPII